jgi:hypothetical protein
VGAAQSIIYDSENALQVAIDVVIPEPQHPEAFTGKVTIARSITPGMHVEIMLTTVDLDQDPVLKTDKV